MGLADWPNSNLILETVLLTAFFLPYVIDVGTPWLRRQVLKYIPSPAVQELTRFVDMLALKSEEIVAKRKAALAASGDDVDEGKDMLSTLCGCLHLTLNGFLLMQISF